MQIAIDEKYLELRTNPRLKIVSDSLPGSFSIKGSDEEFFAVPVDVSRGGIGLRCANRMLPGTKVVYIAERERFEFEVVWCAERKKRNSWRHGLKLTSQTCFLDDFMFSIGCVDLDLE